MSQENTATAAPAAPPTYDPAPPPPPAYYEPPPPPEPIEKESTGPAWSVRADPFNLLIEGRLGLEFEIQLWKFITLETVPILVINGKPPTFNLRGREDNLSQAANFAGPLAGASLGVGFWLGDPFDSYVLKAIVTRYGYTYKTTLSDGSDFDQVDDTETQLLAYFGSQSKYGAFTIGGGIGLGVELTPQQRCFQSGVPLNPATARTQGCVDDDAQLIALDSANAVDLNSSLHPIALALRFSLGVAF